MTTPIAGAGLERLLSAVDSQRMTAAVAALAGAPFTGRRTGTPGSAAARRWLTGRLAALGATVTEDAFPVRAVSDMYAAPSAAWHDGRRRHGLVFGRQIGVHLASAELPEVRRAPVAVAGQGDPSGRWLVVPAGMGPFTAIERADGAAGLLFARDVDADGWHYTTLAGPDPAPLPTLLLDPVTHAVLVAAAPDRQRWFEANVPLRRADATGVNLHARWNRDTPAGVLLTAHYDGVGDLPGLRQPAASDNASGVAVVLEAARVLAPVLDGGLAVALLDAEELGALGSAHHAAGLRRADAAPLVINVDGAGRLGAAAAVEAGGPAHRLLAALDQAGRHTGVPLAPGPMASDNRRYAAAGLAAVGIGAGMGGYHSPADTPDRVDPATLTAVCRLVVATTWLATTVHRLAAPEDPHRPPVRAAARTSMETGRPLVTTQLDHLPVAVVGAGPVGLAAAAHLAERGLPFVVLEAGDHPATAVREWGHVRLFSPWRYNIDAAAAKLLADTGWQRPDDHQLPTGAQLADDYLQPLADSPALQPHIRYGARVAAITRLGFDRLRTAGRPDAPLLIRLDDGEDVLARAVIDATGTWNTPNVLGASGIPAHGEHTLAAYTTSALPDVLGRDRDQFAGRRILVVGAGHSAANTLLALAELAEEEPGTTVTWAMRSTSPARTYGGEGDDALPARGALGTRLREHVESGAITLLTGFSIHGLTTGDEGVEVSDGTRSVVVDRIVSATGFRPDHAIVSELRLDLDPILGSTRALAPLIDPNEHSCGTVPPHGVDELTQPEPGYYAIGVKSYGRAPTFLLATGYEQARSVVAALDGDWAAARDVRLDLPETGVCNSNPVRGDNTIAAAGGGCCS